MITYFLTDQGAFNTIIPVASRFQDMQYYEMTLRRQTICSKTVESGWRHKSMPWAIKRKLQSRSNPTYTMRKNHLLWRGISWMTHPAQFGWENTVCCFRWVWSYEQVMGALLWYALLCIVVAWSIHAIFPHRPRGKATEHSRNDQYEYDCCNGKIY